MFIELTNGFTFQWVDGKSCFMFTNFLVVN